MKLDLPSLKQMAGRIRGDVIEMSFRAKTPHLGSCLSVIDILVAAYFGGALRLTPEEPQAPNRDRVILSKGHAATALYAILARRGYFPIERLQQYAAEGSTMQEHPGPDSVPGVEVATGSLGHGLGVGLGMAVAARSQNLNFRVVSVLSDGECNEGSTWEAALFGAAQKLSNVTVFVDYNKWQATGRSNEVLALAPLREKWAAFGWDAYEIDGHDIGAILGALQMSPHPESRPRAFVCHTIKGKGCSFMEDDNNWHYRIPKAEEVQQAFKELGLA